MQGTRTWTVSDNQRRLGCRGSGEVQPKAATQPPPNVSPTKTLPSLLVFWGALMKYHGSSGLNNRNCFPYSSGGCRYEIKVSVSLLPSERCEGKSAPRFLPSFQWFAELYSVSQFVDVSHQPLPSSSHGVLPACVYLCSNFPFFIRTQSYQIRFQPTDLILIICEDRISKQVPSHRYWGSGLQRPLWGHSSSPNTKATGR